MKKIRLIAAGLAAVLATLGLGAVAYAQEFRASDTVTIPAGQTINQTLFAAGRTVDIAGTVNGDIFCAGQTVSVTGTVNGDVICAGQSVHVSGTVHGNLRLAGQDVSVSSVADRNLTAAGQSVTLEAAGKIGGDVDVAGQNTTINGTVGRDVAGGSSAMAINGTIGRNVQAQVTSLALGSTANVTGDITYVSFSQLSRASGAQVSGKITRTEPAKQTQQSRTGFIGGAWFALYLFVALLVLAILLVLLLPWWFQSATNIAVRSPLKTFLVGLIASIVMPVIIVVLIITFIGLPFGLLVGLAWLLATLLAGPLAAYYLGRLLLRSRATNAVLVMLVGAVVLLIIDLIPFLGWIVSLVALWFGLGMIVLQLSRLPRPHYDVEPPLRRED